MQVEALIDSGATTTFINVAVVEKYHLPIEKLAEPFRVINADGTSNKGGQIKYCVRGYTMIGSHGSKKPISRDKSRKTRYDHRNDLPQKA